LEKTGVGNRRRGLRRRKETKRGKRGNHYHIPQGKRGILEPPLEPELTRKKKEIDAHDLGDFHGRGKSQGEGVRGGSTPSKGEVREENEMGCFL